MSEMALLVDYRSSDVLINSYVPIGNPHGVMRPN